MSAYTKFLLIIMSERRKVGSYMLPFNCCASWKHTIRCLFPTLRSGQASYLIHIQTTSDLQQVERKERTKEGEGKMPEGASVSSGSETQTSHTNLWFLSHMCAFSGLLLLESISELEKQFFTYDDDSAYVTRTTLRDRGYCDINIEEGGGGIRV